VGLRIGFIMDPFERLDSIDEDTSCCLIMECLRRGHTVFYLQIEDLELRAATAWGCVSKILKRQEDKFVMAQPKMMRLDKLQAIFMRKDPPGEKICNSSGVSSSGKRGG